MASNLDCIGLGVAGEAELGDLMSQVMKRVEMVWRIADVDVHRWQDPSGARLIIGTQGHQITDFLPSFGARPGARLADCRPIDDEVAVAAVVDADGEALTSLAVELEQRRQLTRVTPVSGPVALIGLATAVSVFPDVTAFENSTASRLDSNASRDAQPDRLDTNGVRQPLRLAAESVPSFGVFGDPGDADAHARLSATVLSAERRTVSLTGHRFVVAHVSCIGFEVDVCFADEDVEHLPAPGAVVSGAVFMVASMPELAFGDLPPNAEPERRAARHGRFWPRR